MIEAKGKTESFLNAINKYASEQQKEIDAEIELFKKKELEKAETEILEEVHHLIQNKISQMKDSISREISIKEMDYKKKLLNKRSEIVDEIFETCKNKLLEFTGTSEYKVLIGKFLSEVAEILNSDGTILYFKNEDLPLEDDIKSYFSKSCEVRESNKIRIGGIYAVNEQLGIVLDNTLDSKLNEQREWFAENCGLTLS